MYPTLCMLTGVRDLQSVLGRDAKNATVSRVLQMRFFACDGLAWLAAPTGLPRTGLAQLALWEPECKARYITRWSVKISQYNSSIIRPLLSIQTEQACLHMPAIGRGSQHADRSPQGRRLI